MFRLEFTPVAVHLLYLLREQWAPAPWQFKAQTPIKPLRLELTWDAYSPQPSKCFDARWPNHQAITLPGLGHVRISGTPPRRTERDKTCTDNLRPRRMLPSAERRKSRTFQLSILDIYSE